MKPAAFDYVRADTLPEALDALAAGGADARVIAGGMSLLPMLNMRLATPATLVDITRIAELGQIAAEGDRVSIGAGVRQATLESWPDLAAALPLLAKAMPRIGHMQTRSRGTVCGSLAHADPSAELPLCLVLLEGTLEVRRRRKRRSIPASDFFMGMMSTALEPGELITAVTLPRGLPGHGYAFDEVARRHGDFAIAAVAAMARPDGSVRLAVGGVADFPQVLEIAPGDDRAKILNDFAWNLGARTDLHATARYRRDLVRRLGDRTIEEALQCRA